MECNDNLANHSERGVKRLRTEDSTPPHRKDPPTPSSPNDGCRSPTTPVAAPHPPNTDTPSDVDQEMEEQTVINTSKPGWEDNVEDASPPHASKNGEPHTQAEHLVSLHKSLESAMGTLNKLSIHVVLPECTISLVHELYHHTKTTLSVEQGPSDDILATIRKLAKDIEDLKCTATNPSPPPTPCSKPSQTQKCLCHRLYHPSYSEDPQTGTNPITQQPLAMTPPCTPHTTDSPHSRS